MARTGRPKIVWGEKEYRQIDTLASLHCTGEEIASVMGVDYDTLVRLIKTQYKLTFTDWFKKASAGGKVSLRKAQWKAAEAGNVTMQIFLGKQWLGQREPEKDEFADFNRNLAVNINMADTSRGNFIKTPEEIKNGSNGM